MVWRLLSSTFSIYPFYRNHKTFFSCSKILYKKAMMHMYILLKHLLIISLYHLLLLLFYHNQPIIRPQITFNNAGWFTNILVLSELVNIIYLLKYYSIIAFYVILASGLFYFISRTNYSLHNFYSHLFLSF